MRIDISNRIGTTSNFGGFRGLLDKFSGAAAGYSLRKLSKSATNAVRVRRSSDNTEQDIGFTGTELDTAALLAFVGTGATDDGFVTTWYDQSGNGNDATQGSAAAQPKIVSAGVLVTENGKPAVDFDGDFFNATITTISTFTNLSTFWVQTQELAAAPNANTQSLLLIGEGGNVSNGISFSQSTGVLSDETFCMYFRNSTLNNQGRLGSSTYSRAANTQELLTAFNLSTGTSFYSNSVQINLDLSGFITTLTDTSPSNQSLVSNVIAIGQSYSGTTPHTSQEIIFYPSDQSANRIGIEANINKHYNIYP